MSDGPVACAAEIVTSSVVAGAVQINMCVAAGICPLCAASGHAAAVKPAAGSAGAISPADAWIQLLAVPEYAGTSISYISPASNDVTGAPSSVTAITTCTHSTEGSCCGHHIAGDTFSTHAKRMWQAGVKNRGVDAQRDLQQVLHGLQSPLREFRIPCDARHRKQDALSPAGAQTALVATMNLNSSCYCARARCSVHT